MEKLMRALLISILLRIALFFTLLVGLLVARDCHGAELRQAGTWHLLEAREVAIEAWKYQDIHDAYLAPIDEELKYGGAFISNFDILTLGRRGLYMDNRIHFDESEKTSHIKHAGWHFELGLNVIPDRLQIYREHHSRHILEETRPEHFPVYDLWGVRVTLYKRD